MLSMVPRPLVFVYFCYYIIWIFRLFSCGLGGLFTFSFQFLIGIAVTEYKSDIFRQLKAAFVHGTSIHGFVV